jgi:chaperonin cofactor prefoldin
MMLDLSTDFSCVCNRNKELEAKVADLPGRVEHLETDKKTKEEQFEKVNAKILASLHRIIRNEL